MVHALYRRSTCPVPERSEWYREATTGTGQKEKMFFTYILYSLIDKRLYIGFTKNIEKRVLEHNRSKVISTKNRQPLKLIYYEAHFNKQDAIKRERYFKTSKGKTTLKKVIEGALKQVDVR